MRRVFRIAHVINVTEINEAKHASYLHIAQPLTMQSMLIARKIAERNIDVELIAIKHKDEDVIVPTAFRWAPDIDKYAWEYIESLKNIAFRKPLPRLTDIIMNLYNTSDAEYFIYTNVDIGLYPLFYITVRNMIERGYDAFCINRRDLPKEYEGLLLDESNVELIFTLRGIRHPGIDCFVFKRDIVPALNLGNVYIGFPPVGHVLKCQIEANAKCFMWFKDLSVTFHMGNDKAWKDGGVYYEENRKQAKGLYVACFSYRSVGYVGLRNKLKSWLVSSPGD